MEFLKSVFTHPAFYGFVGGLIIGAIFMVMGWLNHLRTKRELKRYQKHVAEKIELEGEHLAKLKGELEKLRTENENLRLKVSGGQAHDTPQAIERELELYARAEKSMVVRAPGFAPAWEAAKDAAHLELVEEERGKSLPRRIFRKFFSGGANAEGGTKLLTVNNGDSPAPEKTGASAESAGH